MKTKFAFRPGYLIAFTLLFIIEVLIALYVRDSFVRPYGGDVLVVLLVYFFVRILYRGSQRLLPFYVFLFALTIEILQWFNITKLLGISQGSILGIALGSSFAWLDIVCYLVGMLIIYIGIHWKRV